MVLVTTQTLESRNGALRGSRVGPFLRWAGGKSLFIKEILGRFPPRGSIGKYYEPFLGAGSVFLAYQPKRAFLSDLNPQLIATFRWIKKAPELIYKHLQELTARDSEDHYYKIRSDYNREKNSILQAARFVYLNKACFNGIFRVNTKGEFNVPYGFKEHLATPELEQLRVISRVLRSATLRSCDYREALADADKGDLVYLDPPYPPLNGSSYFTHYTKERFSTGEQEHVARIAQELWGKGCQVLVTNADTVAIRRLYAGWHITQIERPRFVSSLQHKHRVYELIMTNYEPPKNP